MEELEKLAEFSKYVKQLSSHNQILVDKMYGLEKNGLKESHDYEILFIKNEVLFEIRCNLKHILEGTKKVEDMPPLNF